MPKLGYVDWRKPNNLLALELRITGERVRQMRAERNAPEPLFTDIWTRHVQQCWIIWTKRRVIAGLPPKLAEKHLRFPLPAGSRVLLFAKEHAGLMDRNGKHPWQRMNWALPTADLARIWQIPKSKVQVHRSKSKLRKPQWHPQKTADKNQPAYRKAFAVEKKKAARLNGAK